MEVVPLDRDRCVHRWIAERHDGRRPGGVGRRIAGQHDQVARFHDRVGDDDDGIEEDTPIGPIRAVGEDDVGAVDSAHDPEGITEADRRGGVRCHVYEPVFRHAVDAELGAGHSVRRLAVELGDDEERARYADGEGGAALGGGEIGVEPDDPVRGTDDPGTRKGDGDGRCEPENGSHAQTPRRKSAPRHGLCSVVARSRIQVT